MSSVTAHRTRVPGPVLVVVLGIVLALSGPAAAHGAPGVPDPVGEWPLDPVPEVVAGFDPPRSTWGAGHRGVDLLGTPGQAVRAAMAGVISFSGMIAGRGVVVVDHGDTRTTYEPVDARVVVGESVPAGGRIGVLALPGSHCFPRACLHWGWRRGATYLDPLGLLGAGPVRLLPLWRDDPVGMAATAPPRQPFALPYAMAAPAPAALLPGLKPWGRRACLIGSRHAGRLARPRSAIPPTSPCYARGCACW